MSAMSSWLRNFARSIPFRLACSCPYPLLLAPDLAPTAAANWETSWETGTDIRPALASRETAEGWQSRRHADEETAARRVC